MQCRENCFRIFHFVAIAVVYQIVHSILHDCYYRTCSPTVYRTLFGIQSAECVLAGKALNLIETQIPLAGFALAQGNLRRAIYQT